MIIYLRRLHRVQHDLAVQGAAELGRGRAEEACADPKTLKPKTLNPKTLNSKTP